ncbi:hypothetical protein CYMTET_32049, partial [Cymbomonas tetramitiformis]
MAFTAVAGAVMSYIITLYMATQSNCGHNGKYCEQSCHRLGDHLKQNIVGQDFALTQMYDAVCDHLSEDNPRKPLVLSLHGPPGVGKSYFHMLLAQALYNSTTPSSQMRRCPGMSCPGYHVVFGTDYLNQEREQQGQLLQ